MATITLDQARADLAAVVDRALAGEEIVIATPGAVATARRRGNLALDQNSSSPCPTKSAVMPRGKRWNVRVLLDTSTLLWWYASDPMLSVTAKSRVADDSTTVIISAASAWEICTKVRIGKLPAAAALCEDFSGILRQNRFEPLAITGERGRLAGRLADAHKDRFDRMPAAQALIEGVPLVTNDAEFAGFGVQVVW